MAVKFERTARLINQVRAGELEGIKKTLNEGAVFIDMPIPEHTGFPALYHALMANEDNPGKAYLAITRLLIKRGANINKAYANGETPFVTACCEGLREVVGYLLQVQEPNLNPRLAHGGTVLHQLVHVVKASNDEHKRRDLLAIYQLLLESGASVQIEDDQGVTPILEAIQQGQFDLIQALLSSKSGIQLSRMVNAPDRAGLTPLHYACRCRELAPRFAIQIIEQLLEAKAIPNRVDDYGLTPLHEAVIRGSEAMVKMLLKAGANPKFKSTQKCDERCPLGADPADLAYQLGHSHLVALLEGERGIRKVGDPPTWVWNEDEFSFDGATIEDGQILWFTQFTNHLAGSGGAKTQSFQDFMDGAPNAKPIPKNVQWELREYIENLG